MLGYLQKFNNLPQDLKDKVSSREIMKAIDELEEQYDVNLATVIMKVMVKDIEVGDLPQFFIYEHKFDNIKANDLVDDLKKRVFSQVGSYLGIKETKKEIVNETPDKKANEWLESKREDISARSSNFFFSSEDEEEVRELAKKLSSPEDEDRTIKNEKKIDQIIKEANLNFSSEDIANRLKTILNTYLRGVRTRVDVKHALMKDIGKGGLGMKEGVALSILKIADNFHADSSSEEIKPPPKIRLIEDRPLDISDIEPEISAPREKDATEEKMGLEDSQLRDVGYDFSLLPSASPATNGAHANKGSIQTFPRQITDRKANVPMLDDGDDMLLEAGEGETRKKEALEIDKELEDIEVENTPVRPGQAKTPVSPSASRGGLGVEEKIEVKPKIEIPKPQIQKKPKIEEVKPRQAPSPESSVINMAGSRKAARKDGKIKMEDVKYVPKLLGPIDELREMDLVNFRRLSQNPEEATEKLKEKLGFLEEESYKQRVSGIKAWRHSPVNRLYLKIGQESIVNSRSIEEVINSRQNQGQDYLTSQEFEAIMNLNKSLRF